MQFYLYVRIENRINSETYVTTFTLIMVSKQFMYRGDMSLQYLILIRYSAAKCVKK